MRKNIVKFIYALALLFVAGQPAETSAQFVNPGFEAGTFNGWSTAASASIETGFNQQSWLVTPANSYMALIQPGSGTTRSTAESFLGLSAGALTTMNASVINGSTNFGTIKQSVFLGAGQTVTAYWNYVSQDYSPYNDGVFASLVGPGYEQTKLLAVTVNSFGYPGTIVTGSYGSTGWHTVSFTAGAAGTYTLGLGCFNYSDQAVNAMLFVDDAAGGTSAPGQPVVTTDAATNVTTTTAITGGNVTSDGGATVTARGVVYGTSPLPTLANNVTVDGSGTGTFISNLSGLSLGTTYYARSYATNSAGTSYGNEVSFTTATLPPAGGLNFDGVNDYVRIANPYNSFGNELTIEWNAIIDPSSPIGSGISQSTEDVDGPTSLQWMMHYLPGANPVIQFYVGDNGVWKHADAPVTPGWHKYTGVAGPSGIKIYKDGVLAATSPDVVTGNIVTATNSVITLGKDSRWLNQRYMKGQIDEVRIWNRALCEGEIDNNLSCELSLPQNGLVEYYRFNHGLVGGNNAGVTTLTDLSGNGKNGALLNFALNGTSSNWVAGNVSGSCAAFVPPVANITPVGGATGCGSVVLNANTGTGYAYQWKLNGNNIANATGASYTATTTGSYSVQVTVNGCVAISSPLAVTVNTLPAFTACPSNQSANTALNTCGAVVNYSTSATGIPAPAYSYTFTGATTGSGSGNGSGSTFNTGVTNVIVTASNSCGSAQCSFTVTVTDNQDPKIIAPANLNLNTNSNSCFASNVVFGTPVTSDNCGVASVSNNAPATFPIGTTMVTWTVTDVNGRTATAQNTVTVTDGWLPSITAPANVTVQTSATSCTATGVALGTPVTGDNCAVTSVTNNAPATYPIGNTTVTWTAKDAAGNSKTATQIVTVNDSTAPVIANCPANIIKGNDADSCGASVSWSLPPLPPAPDQQHTGIYTGTFGGDQWQSFTAGQTGLLTGIELFHNGCQSTSFTMTVYAGEGTGGTPLFSQAYNFGFFCSQWFSVNIPSGQQPTVSAGQKYTFRIQGVGTGFVAGPPSYPGGIYFANVYGFPGWELNFKTYVSVASPSVSASDNCLVSSFTSTHQSGDYFPVGTTKVTYTATDASGNSSSCSFNITVNDTQKPIISVANVSVSTNNGCTATNVALGTPVTKDNCGVASVTNNAPASYPVGNTPVLWTVTDIHGNTNTTTQIVTVTDNSNPVVTCPANITISCSASATPANTGMATATDNCAVTSLTFTDASTQNANPNNAGHYNYTITRTWTAKDAKGNFSTCAQTITVQDVTKPGISVPANATVNCQDATTTAALGTATGTDNCSPVTITSSDVSTQNPSNTNAGHYNYTITRTWTATDVTGNATSQDQVITVQDVTNPGITVPQNTTVNCQDDNTPAANGTATGTDNCSPVTITYSDASTQNASNTNAGHYNYVITRTWTATDVTGNSTSADQTITVEDVTNPTIVVPQNMTVNCQDDKSTTANGTATGDDNCSPVTITYSDASTQNASNTNAGHYNYVITRTWTATDVTGNATSQDQTITVQDITAPSISCPANATVSCKTSVADNGTATGSDNCSPVTITSTDASTQDANPANSGHYNYTITRTWKATDVSGNFTTCDQVMTVHALNNPSIAVTPVNTINSNHQNHTIYLGYGPQSVILASTVQDGVGTRTYSWTPTTGVASPNSATTSVSPLTTTTYTVTITDATGCSITKSITIQVIDVRCGNKIQICHYPPGNTGNPQQLCLPSSAIAAHLAHGCVLGNCPQNKNGEYNDGEEDNHGVDAMVVQEVKVYPNPNTGAFTVELPAGMEQSEVVIMDMAGKVIQKKTAMEGNKLQFDLGPVARSMYMLHLTNGSQNFRTRISVQ